jgi:Putative beta-barrel porin-2, OmpL-like. bbp2
MKFRILLLLTFISKLVFAQTDTLKKIILSGYGELYYSYDFSKPPNHEKPDFIFNHKRHNEINTNLILFKAQYNEKDVRVNIGLMAGNYAQYNLSAEPTWAQFIYEANIGLRLSKKNNIWLDAGIMPSHIGFESAISADCWTLTRSLLAENSPYYETGLKLTYVNKSGKLLLSTMFLNGWQRIQKRNNIQKPSFGVQITYRPTEKITLNYSNFIGTDKPDSVNSLRHFHNIYLQFEPTNKFGIIAGFDLGGDKRNLSNYGIWYSPVIIIRQSITNKIRIALRTEYYNDPTQVIIATNTNNGFQTFGVSTNLDYDLNEKLKFRIEGKMYHSKDNIFSGNNNNYTLTTNLAIRL